MNLGFSRQIFEKYSKNKFYENSSSRNRVVPSGWADGRTDMTKLIVALRHLANAPKKYGPEGRSGRWDRTYGCWTACYSFSAFSSPFSLLGGLKTVFDRSRSRNFLILLQRDNSDKSNDKHGEKIGNNSNKNTTQTHSVHLLISLYISIPRPVQSQCRL